MSEKETIIINDDLFLNTVSCPLKFIHITNDDLNRNSSRLYFRQRNKLHIRDAISIRFENNKQTSNSSEIASKETENWLKNDTVAICGAVIQKENLLTRIPILVKEKEKLTIIQVHGKLRKESEGKEIRPGIRKRSIVRYLLKAAYRLEVLKQRFPHHEVDIFFYFPQKHFKSSVDNLNLFDRPSDGSDKIRKELSNLFAGVCATKAVEQVHQQIPADLSHEIFTNRSVADAIRSIKKLTKSDYRPPVNRHGSCKYCEFRSSKEEGVNGCWTQFFKPKDIQHPEKHIFELIGQGNNAAAENGIYYQEEAELSRGGQTLDDVVDSEQPTITILNRRNLQVLQARDQKVPSLWLKNGVKSLDELLYPLHFLDFEAATYALPMKKQSRPYTPVYFQFSCHTLRKNGELIHTEWLDVQGEYVHPHKEFVQQLSKIPDIFEGTIMQYSPFEKQGINRLIADFKRDRDRYQHQLELLEKIRKSNSSRYRHRFFDVSKIIRDYYFNECLNDSLGLKQILKNILEWEKSSTYTDFFDEKMNKMLFDVNEDQQNQRKWDPYGNIRNQEFSISDGADAMNSWLAFKNGLMTEEEESVIPGILKQYCALDSYALFVIFKHLKRFTSEMNDKDYIVFQPK